jgi:hypothetical protein
MVLEFLTPIAGLAALAMAGIAAYLVLKEDPGSLSVREISGALGSCGR